DRARCPRQKDSLGCERGRVSQTQSRMEAVAEAETRLVSTVRRACSASSPGLRSRLSRRWQRRGHPARLALTGQKARTTVGLAFGRLSPGDCLRRLTLCCDVSHGTAVPSPLCLAREGAARRRPCLVREAAGAVLGRYPWTEAALLLAVRFGHAQLELRGRDFCRRGAQRPQLSDRHPAPSFRVLRSGHRTT